MTKKNITILVAGRPYPLTINSEEENVIREIAKELNDMLNRFQLTYVQKDKQDCLAMALLTYAVDLHKMKEMTNNTDVKGKVELINGLLHKALQNVG